MPRYVAETGDITAHKLTDFVSRRAFERTSLFNEFYRVFDIHHQIYYYLNHRPEVQRVISMFRSNRDFTERDRHVLNLLGPHFAQALHNARQLARLTDSADACSDAMNRLQRGIIRLIGKSRVAWMTDRAGELLKAFFPAEPIGEMLPEKLREWVEHLSSVTGEDLMGHPHRSLVIERDRRRLVIQRITGPDGEAKLLLSEERGPGAPEDFKALGLTQRECEVLHWISEGKTNPEIGVILNASPNTVRKHVERVLGKLNLENRGAAMRFAIERRNHR